MEQEDRWSRELVELLVQPLKPAEAKVVTRLAEAMGQFVPGPELAESIWPDRPWARSRNSLQITIHQLRQRIGENVIETRDSSYSLNLPALETFSLRRNYDQQSDAPTSLQSPLAATLRLALASDNIEELLVWGSNSAAAFNDLREVLWKVIVEPSACGIRLYLPASDARRAVDLVTSLEATSGLYNDQLCQKCFFKFSVFVSIPMLGAGQIKQLKPPQAPVAEAFSSENRAILIDVPASLRFIQELDQRWKATKGAAALSLITCDALDREAAEFVNALAEYYARIHNGEQPCDALIRRSR